MSFLKKNLNKFILLIPALFLAKPAFADGPLGFRVTTAASVLTMPFFGEKHIIFYIIFGLFILFLVAFLETLIIKLFLVKKSIKELLKIMLKANFYTTILECCLILVLHLFTISYNSVGPLANIYSRCRLLMGSFLFLAMCFSLFFATCIIEYFVARKYLIKDYSTKKIKIAIIISNIASYIIIPNIASYISIPFVFCLFFLR